MTPGPDDVLHSRHLPMPKGLPPQWNELAWHWFNEAQELEAKLAVANMRLAALEQQLCESTCDCGLYTELALDEHADYCGYRNIIVALAAKEEKS